MKFHKYKCILYCSEKYFTERFNTSYSTENILAKDIYWGGGEGGREKKEEDQAFMIQDWLIENKKTSFLKISSNRVIQDILSFRGSACMSFYFLLPLAVYSGS